MPPITFKQYLLATTALSAVHPGRSRPTLQAGFKRTPGEIVL